MAAKTYFAGKDRVEELMDGIPYIRGGRGVAIIPECISAVVKRVKEAGNGWLVAAEELLECNIRL